ncbi:hypothetical protein BH09ACT5_BH09ACT5_15120 [soil metagenome]
MDLVALGFAGLVLAVAGALASTVLGLRDAIGRAQERRYLERTARLTGRSQIAR